jgi:hypothetical protein
MSIRSARFISPSAKVGGRSVSQKRAEIRRLPFKGVQVEKGVTGVRAKGSRASLAQEARNRERDNADKARFRVDTKRTPPFRGISEEVFFGKRGTNHRIILTNYNTGFNL